MKRQLFTKNLENLAKISGKPLSLSEPVTGAGIDSRLIKRGEVFFALKGERVDGHDYLSDVAKQKASAAVVSMDYKGDNFGLQLVRVASPLRALHNLAKEVFAERKTRVIAVTGSVGKTTTKEFIATLLEAKYKVGKSPGNSNSQVGVPLTILNSEGDEEILVLEMGMSASGEIEKLVQIAPPEVVLINRVSLAHVAFFEDGVHGIARAKAEILTHPKTRLGIVNLQACQYDAVLKTGTCRKQTYALFPNAADCVLETLKEGYVMKEKQGVSPAFSLPFGASQLCENFLGAAAVARSFGLSWDEIILQAKNLRPYKWRFEMVEKDGILFVNDAYNANPESMRAALSNLPHPKDGARRIAVLGEMKELGRYSEEAHRQVAEAALGVVDHLLCLGKESLPMVEVFSKAGKKVEHFMDIHEISKRVHEMAKNGDVVLLKGSNSNGLWRVLEEKASH